MRTKSKNILVPSNKDASYLVGMPPTFSVNTDFSTPKEGVGFTDTTYAFWTLFLHALWRWLSPLPRLKWNQFTTCDSVSTSLTAWKVCIFLRKHLSWSCLRIQTLLPKEGPGGKRFPLPLGVSIHQCSRGICEDAGRWARICTGANQDQREGCTLSHPLLLPFGHLGPRRRALLPPPSPALTAPARS